MPFTVAAMNALRSARDADFAAPGILVAASLDIALALARADACRRGADAVMIVGGAEIYAQALPVADRMEMTLVHMTAAGETRFPPVDPAEWREHEKDGWLVVPRAGEMLYKVAGL